MFGVVLTVQSSVERQHCPTLGIGPPFTSVNIDGPPRDSPNLLGEKRGHGGETVHLDVISLPCKWSPNSNVNAFGSDRVPVFGEPQGGGGGCDFKQC